MRRPADLGPRQACGAPASAPQRRRASISSRFASDFSLTRRATWAWALGISVCASRITQQLATSLQVRAGAGHLAGQSKPAREFLGLQRSPTPVRWRRRAAPARRTALALRQLMDLLAAGSVRALQAAPARCASGRRLSARRTAPASASAARHRCRLGVQGLPPRTFLLQPIGDPLIEALQPLVLGPFLNIERALRTVPRLPGWIAVRP